MLHCSMCLSHCKTESRFSMRRTAIIQILLEAITLYRTNIKLNCRARCFHHRYERNRLARFHELLCLCADTTEHDPIGTLYPLIVGLFFQIRNICQNREATAAPASHSKKILYDFLDSLHTNYRQHRRVSFYADALSLTPRHLTTVIRQASGRSASQWIEEYTVLEAQILLRNSPMSIKEIAYELGFNDQSLFSKYFSRVAGISPERYRKISMSNT